MSWGKILHCILSPFLPFISTERPHTLFSAACVHGIHGKVLQAFVNTQERKCQGRLMGEVKSSWKKFRSSLARKGNLKGWLCDYEHFSCWIGSSQAILLMAYGGEMKLLQLIYSNRPSLLRAADQQQQWAGTHRSAIGTIQIKLILIISPPASRTAHTRHPPCWARTAEQAGQGCPPPSLAASFPSGNLQLSPPFQSQLLTCFLTLSSHLREELLSPRGQSWRWVCSGRAVTLIMKYFASQSMLTPCFTTIWLNFPLHQI